MIYSKSYYSMGQVGYNLWRDEEDIKDGTMHIQFIGLGLAGPTKVYKIQQRNTRNLRPFVRVYGRRIYLDECLRL